MNHIWNILKKNALKQSMVYLEWYEKKKIPMNQFLSEEQLFGVVLCILAVIPTIIAGSMEASDYYCGLSVGLLLFILAIGVNLLVRVGMVKSSYDTLLQEGEYTKEEKLFKKKTDTFSGVYWCLTTAIYLAWSFRTMSWDITWIVWPVAGVLFAALLGVVKMVLKNGSETQHYI